MRDDRTDHDLGASLMRQIFQVIQDNNASSAEGASALAMSLIVSLHDDGCSKQEVIEAISEVWDLLVPGLKFIKDRENVAGNA